MIYKEPIWKSYIAETTVPIFTPEQCNDIIRIGRQQKPEHAMVGSGTSEKTSAYDTKKRVTTISWIPFDALRELGSYNWWLSNIMAWIFTTIGICAFTYWMIQLKKFDDNNEEDKSITAHDYL